MARWLGENPESRVLAGEAFGQDQFAWESKFYRPDTAFTSLGYRVPEPTHLPVAFINWSKETAEIGVSVAVIPE